MFLMAFEVQEMAVGWIQVFYLGSCTVSMSVKLFLMAFEVQEMAVGWIQVFYLGSCTVSMSVKLFLMAFEVQEMAVGWIQVAKQCQDKFPRVYIILIIIFAVSDSI